MKWHAGGVGLVLIAGWLSTAAAQQTQTVQLPTFNFTTASTTVSVPDGGSGLLGGIKRASEGSNERGVPILGKTPGLDRLFRNRGIGREVGLTQMTVTPRIIILEEEEFRQTGVSADTLSAMSGPPRSGGFAAVQDPLVSRKAAFLSAHVARNPDASRAEVAADERLPSVDEIRRQTEATLAQRVSEAEEYFAQGQRAEAEGKTGVAKIYYQMAARRATGALLQETVARLSVLENAQRGTKLAER
jgi:hypothetical protein